MVLGADFGSSAKGKPHIATRYGYPCIVQRPTVNAAKCQRTDADLQLHAFFSEEATGEFRRDFPAREQAEIICTSRCGTCSRNGRAGNPKCPVGRQAAPPGTIRRCAARKNREGARLQGFGQGPADQLHQQSECSRQTGRRWRKVTRHPQRSPRSSSRERDNGRSGDAAEMTAVALAAYAGGLGEGERRPAPRPCPARCRRQYEQGSAPDVPAHSPARRLSTSRSDRPQITTRRSSLAALGDIPTGAATAATSAVANTTSPGGSIGDAEIIGHGCQKVEAKGETPL